MGYNSAVLEIKCRWLRWLGHVLRMPRENIPKVALRWTPHRRRKSGWPTTTWSKTVMAELQDMGRGSGCSKGQDPVEEHCWNILEETIRTSSNDTWCGNMGTYNPRKEQASSHTNKDRRRHHIPGQKNKHLGKRKDKGHRRYWTRRRKWTWAEHEITDGHCVSPSGNPTKYTICQLRGRWFTLTCRRFEI